jgi:hypothetical protein
MCARGVIIYFSAFHFWHGQRAFALIVLWLPCRSHVAHRIRAPAFIGMAVSLQVILDSIFDIYKANAQGIQILIPTAVKILFKLVIKNDVDFSFLSMQHKYNQWKTSHYLLAS